MKVRNALGVLFTALILASCSSSPGTPDNRFENAIVEASDYEIVGTAPHDPTSFTQGLEFLPTGELIESSGLYGESRITLLDRDLKNLSQSKLELKDFGEGLTVINDVIYQLTWREGKLYKWSVDPSGKIAKISQESIKGEGWGLCHDKSTGSLHKTDGSDSLFTLDTESLTIESSLKVTLNGAPLDQLNELECLNGFVYANVWKTPLIVKIDTGSGRVISYWDLSEVVEDAKKSGAISPEAVLNGIAYSEKEDLWYVTGKWWLSFYKIKFLD